MENPIDIRNVFKTALDQTVARYAEKSRLEIAEFILHICGEVRPYMVVTNAGAASLADEIFTNELRRDFIFNLLFNFCPRLSFDGEISNEYHKLVTSMTFALSIADPATEGVNSTNQSNNNSTNMLPEELVMRLPTSSEITVLLKNNKWLMMILLISFYIAVEDFKLTEDGKKKKT